MIRETVAAATIVSGLLAGCSFDGGSKTEIDLTVLPDKLPAAVGEVASRAVLISMRNANVYVFGSGFRLNNTQVLTAGHILVNSDNWIRPETNGCDRVFVHGHPQIPDSSDSNSPAARGKISDVRRFVGSFKDDNTVPDLAMLNIEPGSYPRISELPMRTDEVRPGEAVYFITYQPKGKISRDPVQALAGEKQKPGGYRAPAIFGGIVYGKDDSGRLKVANGLKSYGQINDTLAVHGSSGGMLVDGSGREVGTSVRSHMTKLAAKDLGSDEVMGLDDGVQFTAASQDLSVSMALIQPTTPSVIEKLKKGISNAPFCWENE